MPTPAERQALAFLALVAALGGAARLVQARQFERALESAGLPAPAEALVAQVAAVDRARDADAARTPRPPARGGASRGARAAATRPAAATRGPAASRPSRGVTPADEPLVVNVDRADVAELDRLPGVGPALAARIVADRDSLGPFGSLEGLQRVRGIGPATAARLAAHVTFSTGLRPSHGTARPPR